MQYQEAASVLQLGLQLHHITPVKLQPQDQQKMPALVRMPRQVRDLKKLARLIGETRSSGARIVLVGPEHNREVQRHPELLRYVASAGAAFCGLAASLADKPGYRARSTARRIVTLGYYSYMAGFTTASVHPRQIARVIDRINPGWRKTQNSSEEILKLRPPLLLRQITTCGHPDSFP